MLVLASIWLILSARMVTGQNVLMSVLKDGCFTNSSSAIAAIYRVNKWEYNFKFKEDYQKNYFPQGNVNILYASSWIRRHSFDSGPINHLVTDKRWEKLDTYFTRFTDTRGQIMQFSVLSTWKNKNFEIPFSLYAEYESHVYLCNDTDVSTSHCYWFLLDAFNGIKSAFRECYPSEIEKKYDGKSPKGNCFKSTRYFSEHQTVLHQDKWNHFTITMSNSVIRLLDENGMKLFEQETKIVFEPNSFIVHTKRVNGLWKVHDYNYFYNEHSGNCTFVINSIPLGYKCWSMFVALCPTCYASLTWYHFSPSEVIKTDTITGKTVNSSKWFYYKNCFNMVKTTLYMEVATFNPDNNEPSYWALDQIAVDNQDDMRYLKPISQYWTNTCQFLANGMSLNLNKPNTVALENWRKCSEYELGEDCIPCRSLPSNNYCSNPSKYCQLIMQANGTITDGCYCPPGFEGPQCQERCSSIYLYGHSCKNNCEWCTEGCSKDTVTGICNNGQCSDNHFGDKCDQIIGFYWFNHPPQIQPGRTSCNLTMTSLEGTGNRNRINQYVIQYKTDRDPNWINQYVPLEPSTTFTHLENLKSNTVYYVRVFGFENKEDLKNINDPNHHVSANLKIYNFTTTCKDLDQNEVLIEATTNYATITIKPSYGPDSCTLDDYKITVNGKEVIFVWHAWKVNNLQPYTPYMLTLTRNNLKINKPFVTMEDVPSKVENLQVEYFEEGTPTLQWTPPKNPNGVLLYYTISVKLTRYLGCDSPDESSASTYYYLRHEDNHLSWPLTNLSLYAEYKLSVAANTSAGIGPWKYKIIKTLSKGTLDLEELPQVEIFPDVYKVKFSFDIDCTRILGPLSLFVNLEGKSDWCEDSSKSYNTPMLKEFTLHKLKSFCNYTSIIGFHRKDNYREVKFNFSTLESAPNPVKELLVNSKGPDHIALRWRPPQPPTGRLESYRINVFNSDSKIIGQVNTPDKACKLWKEYCCATLRAEFIEPNMIYALQVTAKNYGSSDYSKEAKIPAETAESKPERPYNLIGEWTWDNCLILTWFHPNVTNGILQSFIIYIDKIMQTYVIYEEKEYLPIYTKRILKEDLNLASLFWVNVTAKNSHSESNPAQIQISSPPPIPQDYVEGIILSGTSIAVTWKNELRIVEPFSRFVYIFTSTHYYCNNELATDGIAALVKHHQTGELPYEFPNWVFVHYHDFNEDTEDLKFKQPSLGADCVGFVWIHQYQEHIRNNSFIHFFTNNHNSSISNLPSIMVQLALGFTLLVGLMILLAWRIRLKQNISSFTRVMTDWGTRICSATYAIAERVELRLNTLGSVISGSQGSNDDTTLSEQDRDFPVGTTFRSAHTKQVKLENFSDYVKRSIGTVLQKQYKTLPKGLIYPARYASMEPNKRKNRYRDVIPYDHNRVVLDKIDGDEFSDYINASYIDGYRHPRAYIATQGPKLNTVGDFWRMVWQEGATHIIMVANLIEDNQRKVHQYWPDANKEAIFGSYTVMHMRSEVHSQYVWRIFQLKFKNSQPRKIHQFHYKVWPDHGVPSNPQTLLPLFKLLFTLRSGNFPVIVHCSAGVGRTGTIILSDICLRMAAHERHVDVFAVFEHLRNSRCNMIGNVAQYQLAHLIILNCLNRSPRTLIPIDNQFRHALSQMASINEQFNYIKNCQWQDDAITQSNQHFQTFHEFSSLIVKKKNRFSHIVPEPSALVYLEHDSSSDSKHAYINAVYVDGLSTPKKFIATQYPLPNTVNDLWRLVTEQGVSLLVCLNDFPLEDETCPVFWPSINNVALQPTRSIKVVYLRTSRSGLYSQVDLELHEVYQEPRLLNLLLFHGWTYPAATPDCVDFTSFLGDISVMCDRSPKTLVACYDGATASGLFIASLHIMEQIQRDLELDVCQAVRTIRINRKQFVNSKEQLSFLYQIGILYVERVFFNGVGTS